MSEIMIWLFKQLSYFIEQMLSWKIWDDFSLLHFIIALSFLGLLLSFFFFGEFSIGGTSEYVGAIRRHRNAENRSDREKYATKIYDSRVDRIDKKTGEVVTSRSVSFSRRRRE